MKSQNEEQKLTEAQTKAKQPRFKIEKLEERIAPAKGGVPGPPENHTGGGPKSCGPGEIWHRGYCST